METIDPGPRGAKFPSRQSLKCEGIGAAGETGFARYGTSLARRRALSPSLRGAKRRSNPESLRGDSLDCFATLAMTECVVGSVAKLAPPRPRQERRAKPYSSLPRVIAMDASVLVRVHSMLRRR